MMSAPRATTMVNGAVYWSDEPHHITLLKDPQYTVYVGDLPPHDQTLLHTHDAPSAFVSLMSATDIINRVLSDPDTGDMTCEPVSIAKGVYLSYKCTPQNPHTHFYSSTGYRSMFLGIECPLGRVIGAPAPMLSLEMHSSASVSHGLEDATFASSATVSVPQGCTVRVSVNPADGDKVVSRIVVCLDGPTLSLLDLQTPAHVAVEHIEYRRHDPPLEINVLSGFSNTKQLDERMIITNSESETAQIAIIDCFASAEKAQ